MYHEDALLKVQLKDAPLGSGDASTSLGDHVAGQVYITLASLEALCEEQPGMPHTCVVPMYSHSHSTLVSASGASSNGVSQGKGVEEAEDSWGRCE